MCLKREVHSTLCEEYMAVFLSRKRTEHETG